MSSTSTLRSGRHGSMGSLDSNREPFNKSPRSKRIMEDIPEGPSKCQCSWITYFVIVG